MALVVAPDVSTLEETLRALLVLCCRVSLLPIGVAAVGAPAHPHVLRKPRMSKLASYLAFYDMLE